MKARQVGVEHYDFRRYMSKGRWSSIWHQVSAILEFEPKITLEIGPGGGVLKAVMESLGFSFETLDVDPQLNPDYTCSADDMPFDDRKYNVVCAFQVLEHMPFEDSLKVFSEMCRVAEDAVVISLPDAKKQWSSVVSFPFVRVLRFSFSNPIFSANEHVFDGEHYWEVNKKGYEFDGVCQRLREVSVGYHMSTYRVFENPYHRFFVFRRRS